MMKAASAFQFQFEAALLSLFLILLFPVFWGEAVKVSKAQISTLLSIKRSLDPSNSYLVSWARETDCGLMYGVGCDPITGNVVQLSLGAVGLNGTIPENIWMLSDLTNLDMSSNQLTGPIPNKIGNLVSLASLNLNENLLTGVIPDSIGNLQQLTILNLGQNLLNGSIPSSIGSLSKAKFLVLNKNLLVGPIPDSIGEMKSLLMLSLSFNSLSGSIPPSLSQIPSLGTLDLTHNDLSGPIPSALYSLTSLTSAVLSSNLLSGAISEEIGNWTNIINLDLSLNNFTGPLPYAIGLLTSMQLLDVSVNSLSGPLPASITACTSLINLRLGLNNFSGPLPQDIGSMTTLTQIHLFHNSFSGTIPPSIGNLQFLSQLDFSVNGFEGSIPSSLSKLSLLTELDLSENLLTGPVPPTFAALKSLVDIDLHSNQLSGPLPLLIRRMVSLQTIDLSNNNFTGQVEDTFASLASLRSLSLFRNQFHGPLPNLKASVNNMILSFNKFSGALPTSYILMPNLTVLQLSHCQLSSALPSDLSFMRSLAKIDVSFNQIIGSLPASFPSQLKSLNFQGNKLSGTISRVGLPKLPSLETVDLSSNALSGTVPHFASPELAFLILSNNQFSDVEATLTQSSSNSFVFSMMNNPWCQSPTNQLLTFCSTDGQLYSSFSSPALCSPDPPCPSGQEPNPNLKFSKGLCQCSDFFLADMMFTTPFFDFLNPQIAGKLITALSTYVVDSLGQQILNVNQIRIAYATQLPGGLQRIDFHFFTMDGLPWESYEEGKVILTLFENSKYNSELAPMFGAYFVTGFGAEELPSPNVTSPPPGPLALSPPSLTRTGSSSKSESPLPILIAVVAVALLVVLGAVFAFVYLRNKKGAAQASSISSALSDMQVKPESHFVQSIPLPAILKATNNFGADHLLGEGGHGSVYMGVGADGHVWAIKRSKIVTARGLQLLQNEIDSLSKVSHRNLVKLLGFCDESNEQILIYEFVSNGNLQEHLRPKRPKTDTRGNSKNSLPPSELAAGSATPAMMSSHSQNLRSSMPPKPPLKPSARSHKSSSDMNSSAAGSEAATPAGSSQPSPMSTRPPKKKGTTPSSAADAESRSNASSSRVGSGPPSLDVAPPKKVRFFKSTSVEDLNKLENEDQSIGKYRPYHSNAPSPSASKKFSFGFGGLSGRKTFSSDAANGISSEISDSKAEAMLPVKIRPPLSFETRLNIAIGTAEGLHYLHSFANPGIIHRDVKSENILLTDKLEAKLADFGLLKSMKDDSRAEAMSTRVAGTPGYMDPEYYKTFKVTAKSDVYSFGVVLLELITGRPPAMDHATSMPPQPNGSEGGGGGGSKNPSIGANEPTQFITIAEWAFPLIANGEMEALADPRLGEDYPREALRKMSFVALQCIQRKSADRPNMGDVVLMLKDIQREVMGKQFVHQGMPIEKDYSGVPISEFGDTNLGESVSSAAPVSMMLGGR